MQKIPSYLLKIILFFSFLDVSAQVQKIGIPEIEYFNRRMYNGATQNWGISQSKEGFIYFANNDGVLEFDGAEWRIYKDLNPSVIRCVGSIDDKLYVGAYNEVGYYKYNSLSQLEFTSLVQSPKMREMDDVWGVHKWNNKVVFNTHKSLNIFKKDTLLTIIESKSRFITAAVVNGLLLVHDENIGLLEVRGDKTYPIAGGGVLAEKEVTAILPLSSSQILIGTMNNGLYLWDMQKIQAWDVSANNLLKQVNIFCGVKYKDDFFVFGTIQGGLVITDMQGDVFMQINKDKGLKNNTVHNAFVDREGNIWAGLDNGIAKVNFNSSISFLQGYYNLGTGYVMDKYKGEFYFGTNQALYKISEANFKNPLKNRDDFSRILGTEGQVWSLFRDENSLLCGHNLGVFEIKNLNTKILTPPDVNGVWNFKAVINHPELLLSGTYNGLVVFEKKNGKWVFRNKVDGFKESARFIEWDENGDLWISHGYQGVYKLKINDDLTRITELVNYKNTDFPGNLSSLVLVKIEGENLFVSTDGIYKVNASEMGFERNSPYEELFINRLFPSYIYEDEFRNLWCFYNGRVEVFRHLEDSSYKKINYPFLSFERQLVNGFESLYVQDKNNVFFGVEDGFAHYSVEDFKNYKTPFNTHIRSFKGREDTITYQLNSREYKQYFVPEYPFRKNLFQIKYAASFHENRDVMFSSFLNGYEQHDTDWKKENYRNFANLSEGEYEFVVKAKNSYGIESLPVKFKFVVLPPWQRSTLAKIGFSVLFLLLIVLVYYVFSKRVELSRQKEKRKQQERYKMKEEQLKNSALTSEKEMIRMRNEKLRGEMVFKEKELANSTIHLVQKNDLLSDIKSHLKKIIKISDKSDLDRTVRNLIKKIDRDIDNDNNWEVFEMHFGRVHEAFFQKLKEKHPELTNREQKLSAYIKMGMASKDIASLMNITTRAVENNRYKLRQKLTIQQGENLLEYIESI